MGVAVYDSETDAYYLVEDESGEKHKMEDANGLSDTSDVVGPVYKDTATGKLYMVEE